ncbi:MAG: hypothetical protein A3D99_03795 [Candidatus Andersenbacteria bacterium RIFCSPHIGHO2_12_FULL_45_11]|uniref:MHD domain-containing protein n=1 Tax=Candidatus Andersenbacteria bacterium RIFCSPHIGHO2_12_FULL_45_11 TaxID=1797281 RepID=A0A1G1X0V5_9BACT|nr:MAG: hypothetical protein A3D99_03795 [Candidatus Andersenbacteria bacterium RIFCSPHIGHO2_12_FULL_45_11]
MAEDEIKKIEEDGISMLTRDLYARDESDEMKKRTKDLLTPKQPIVRPEAIASKKPGLINIMDARARRRRAIILWGCVALGALLIFGGGVWLTLWYRSTNQVNATHINLAINSPAHLTAGCVIQYSVAVQNTSNVDWTAADVLFTPPTGFVFQESTPVGQVSQQNISASLGSLAANETKTFSVSGRLIGEEGETALARAEVSISPINYQKERITASQTATTIIGALPLDISIEAAKSAAVGERIAAIIHVRNLSDIPIEGAALKLSPPAGMQLAVEDSGFSPDFSVIDSFWKLPTLKPLDEIVRYSVLYVNGASGDRRELGISIIQQQKDRVFTLRDISHVVAVTSSQLTVGQTFNKDVSSKLIVAAGQRIDGAVQYKNTGSTGLTDAIVKVKFEGTGLDPATIKLTSGAYDPTTSTITWTAASLPALKNVLPGSGGEIPYSFTILPYDKFPLQPNGKNQQLIATASLDSPDLPTPTGQARQVISDRFLLPVQTGILLGVDAFYDDGRLGITSTGPLPPKVGEQTTYTLRTRIGSTLNDVESMKIVIVLPDGVAYTNKMYKTIGEADFNDRTNTMTWTMPLMEGLTGRATPPQELDMQIAITPGENVRGQEVRLMQSIKATGTDSFTDGVVEATITEYPTTRGASQLNGEVE